MKKYLIFIFAPAILCLALAGCDKEEYGDPALGGVDTLFIYPGMSYSVPLSGGSGNYTAELRGGGEPAAIADVFIDRSNGVSLVVETREGEGGSANIVVTDTESGKTADCFLMVVNPENFGSGWGIDEQQHSFDAFGDADVLESDLQGKLFPVGTTLSFDPHIEHPGNFGTGHWVVQKIANGVADTLVRGTFTSMPLDLNKIPKAYDSLLPIEQEIHSAIRYVFQQEDGEHVYDLFFVYTRESFGSLDRMMYEDRTEYYRAKYPNAKVTSVVNRYVQRFYK